MAITLGDVCGIGPEITIKTLAGSPRLRSRCILIGDPGIIRRELRAIGFDPDRIVRETDSPEGAQGEARRRHRRPGSAGASEALWVLAMPHGGLKATPRGKISALAGSQAAAWLDAGAELARDGRVGALVTAPVNKAAVARTRPGFRGHTEHIARIVGAPFPVMMLAGKELRVVPVTRHISLVRAAKMLSVRLVLRTVVETARGLRKWFRIPRPRIAVCGLNPHAGEDGLMGSEDSRIVAPAVRGARRAGVRATGPLPADMVFAAMRAGRYDAVVAMYHDQAMIPIKTVEVDLAVNATLGLPFLRTSPAHGTAFDIAGRGIARNDSMRAAIELAVEAAQSAVSVVG